MFENEKEELLARYYAGATSLEEERLIRQMLLKEAAEGETSADHQLAEYFRAQRTIGLSQEASSSLKANLENFKVAGNNQAANLNSNSGSTKSKLRVESSGPRLKISRRLLAIAASLLLVLSIWYLQPTSTPQIGGGSFPLAEATDWSKYEVTDPEEAAAILMGSLKTVSDNFSAGQRAIQRLERVGSLGDPLRE